jgi:hypothetical protein
MKRLHSLSAIALTGLVGFSSVCAPLAAHASEEGKKNTAIALGAAAVGLLLTQKNKLPGLVAAGGAAYAYSEYEKDHRNRDRYGYDDRYRSDDRYGRDDYRSRDDRSRADDRSRTERESHGRIERDNDRTRADSNYRYRENTGSQDTRYRDRADSDRGTGRRPGLSFSGK